MPVVHVDAGGLPAFRWGADGRPHVYDPTDTPSIRRAHHLAVLDGGRIDARRSGPAVPPRPLFPTRIEEAYRRTLLRRVSGAHAALLDRLLPTLARLEQSRGDGWRVDSAADDIAKIVRVVEAVEVSFGRAFKPDADALATTAGQVDTYTSGQQRKIVQSVAAIKIGTSPEASKLHDRWARENVGLIKSIDERYFDDVRDVVVDAVHSGRQTSEIVSLLRERYDVSRSRAELIATDQIAKLNGQITQKRQTDLGITRYRWSTSLDARVRPDHRVREGRVFEWKSPPEDGHPGQAIRCRCVAIPVFDDDEGEQPAEAAPASAFRGTTSGWTRSPFRAAG